MTFTFTCHETKGISPPTPHTPDISSCSRISQGSVSKQRGGSGGGSGSILFLHSFYVFLGELVSYVFDSHGQSILL